VVTLDRNNRVLVAQGLRRIRAGRCVPGIRALIEAAGRRLDQATAADLGFAVAPRLNAAGRLTDMSVGIACLLADDPVEAAQLAGQLTRLNEERREIEQRMQLEAVDIAAGCASTPSATSRSACVCSTKAGIKEWWTGGRQDQGSPASAGRCLRAGEDGSLRGSARSVSGVNIRDALEGVATHHPGIIVKFGGHAMAAGLTLAEANLDQFRAAFAAEIAARADLETLTGVIHSDGELQGAELSVDTARILRGGGPWGQGFPSRFSTANSRSSMPVSSATSI